MIIVAATSRVGERVIGGVDLLKLFGPSGAFSGACGDAVRVRFQSLSCFSVNSFIPTIPHGSRVAQTSCRHLKPVVEMQCWLSRGWHLDSVSEKDTSRVQV